MSESESDALPLGDTPRFSTLGIISHRKRFVNTYFKLFLKKYSFFRKIGFFYFTKYVFCDTIHKSILYLPVAQLDSASDSDSEGQRFESVRVGQKNDKFRQKFVVFYSSRRLGMESRVSVYGIAVGVWHHQRCIFLRLDSIRLLCNQFHTATSCGFHARLCRD